MKLSSFDYYLPQSLIAQKPIRPRNNSRLMILNKQKKIIQHNYFHHLQQYLKPGDLLVLNDSKVIPARLLGKKTTGGKTEILLLKPLNPNKDYWEAIVKGKSRPGTIINFSSKLQAELVCSIDKTVWKIRFNLSKKELEKQINVLGIAPVPPYIKRHSNLKEYQTVYAKNPGSAAAPTAGFHFTKAMIKDLKKQGIQFGKVTLHVGIGTFTPVRAEKIEKHKMHSEWGEINKKTAEKINNAKKKHQRIIAVGTTSARTLEFFTNKNGKIKPGQGWIDLFIYPGYQFKLIDGIITNFHLPKSTLLMLVSALAGQKFMLQAYKSAIEKKYRFYSFGDATLIF